MATLSTSTSPQWDNRNRGFISPAELQQLRQASPGRGIDLHEFPARQPQPPAAQVSDPQAHPLPQPALDIQQQPPTLTAPQPRPSMPPSSQSHARTSSFFSFRTKQPSQEQQKQGRDIPPQSPPSAFQNRRPSTTTGAPTDFGPSPPQMGQSRSVGPGRPPSDQQVDQQPAAIRRSSLAAGQSAPPPLHPEIRSVVQLTLAHARKVYFSGPLIKRVERQPDGQKPIKDEGWVEVWAQLGGTTLSIWDMREVEEANKQGKEVPPTYVNMTDAFVQVLGSITVPPTDVQPAKKYTNVLTLNTAGSNLLLFSCPSTAALISWATALRLSAWEKSRLEEIYTAHLIRITLPDGKDSRSTLVRGRMEGWVRIRVAGQTDWKRMWMIVSSGSQALERTGSLTGDGTRGGSPPRKKRMSHLFSRDHAEELPPRPILSLYASSKPKDKKKPLLTLRDITQAFAVYPERPELINRSTLMKLEGLIGDEDTAGAMKGREGWLLVMPELEAGNTQASEMLKWLIALHDAFQLYGRPKSYTWDPRDPVSMMFAYPVGPARDLLFLDRELAEAMDPRDDRTSTVRSRLLSVLLERMRSAGPGMRPDAPPALPPLSLNAAAPSQPPPAGQPDGQPPVLPQLPSLDFGNPPPQPQSHTPPQEPAFGRALSPITERSMTRETLADFARAHGHSLSGEQPSAVTQSHSVSDENEPLAKLVLPSTVLETAENGSVPPTTGSPQLANAKSRKPSEDSFRKAGSRPDSKLSPSVENMQTRSLVEAPFSSGAVEIMGVKLPFSPMASPEPPSFSASSSLHSMSVRSPSPGKQVPPLPSPGSPGPMYASLDVPPTTTGRSARTPTPGSSAFSILTSPYSLVDKDLPSIQAVQSENPRAPSPPHPKPSRSPMQGSVSPNLQALPAVPEKLVSSPQPSRAPAPPTKPAPVTSDPQSVFTDALFYMQQLDEQPAPPRRVPTTISEKSDSSATSEYSAQPSQQLQSISSHPSSHLGQSGRRGTAGEGLRPSLGRKPSGARAQPGPSRVVNPEVSSVSSPEQQLREHDSDTDSMPDDAGPKTARMLKKPNQNDDVNADALAALSFLDSGPTIPTQQPVKTEVPPRSPAQSPSPPREHSPQLTESTHAAGSSEHAGQYRSTFAPSKQAEQRKARLQAQQAAQQAAAHKPGRANGRRTSSGPRTAGWNESSEDEDEEEEEEEDEDEDADSDDEPSPADSKRPSQTSGSVPVAPPVRPLRPQSRTTSPAETATDANPYAQLRHPRNLPPVPRPQTQGAPGAPDDFFGVPPPQRRFASDQRPRTPEDVAQMRPHPDFPPQVPQQRQSMWTQVLEPGRQPGAHPQPEAPPLQQRDTFIQLEPASHSMTKAFTPHGLLSAGMQDKQDRSAKRQEELARETGASLINVPNKPPPPQTGLLGAITAHERERKREGGVGATLTEREREKRLAEDRQRKLDELQRQQLELAQSGMFPGQQFPMAMNPMMGNPMMMGMNPMMTGTAPMMTPPNPMMTGGYMGYPNMMPGYGNQQALFAAQQAAQAAYQQAMMAFSAGSHVGDGMQGGPSPMAPMMTGGGMGFDPRMSMMGMPMMNSPMPMAGMGMPMGGMGTMGGMSGMGMQMTGGAFDPRFTPGGMDDLRPPGAVGGQRPGNNSSRNSSAGQGSPAGPRPVDAAERSRDSPKS